MARRPLGFAVADLDARLLPPEDVGHEDDIAFLGEVIGHAANCGVDAENVGEDDEAWPGARCGLRHVGLEGAAVIGLDVDVFGHGASSTLELGTDGGPALATRLRQCGLGDNDRPLIRVNIGHLGRRLPVEPARIDFRQRNGVDELAGVGVPRAREQLRRRPLFDDPALQHDDDALAEHAHDGQIMGDEGQRQPHVLLQLAEQRQDLRLRRDIEAGDDFVRQDEGRLVDDGAGDAGTLALAAGELMGIAGAELLRETRPLERPHRQRARQIGPPRGNRRRHDAGQ